MATSLRRLLLLVVAAAAATAAAAQPAPTVVFLPLDERFTTRDAFLNLARVTNFT
jgi:ABC-type sugar transport system substrate-binding protein